MLEEIIGQGDKVVVFYSLTNAGLFPLGEHLKDLSPLYYHGEMTSQQKDDTIAQFRSDPEARLLLASDAAQTGLNLPEAGYVIHYNTPFLWTTYVQRSDRIHRIDSEREQVTIYRFLTEGTIEARIEDNMTERRLYSAELGLAGEFEDSAEVISQADLEYWLFGGTGG
jgi:SNF2 family DNA or RNA helicase